jgi:hypothetical protein
MDYIYDRFAVIAGFMLLNAPAFLTIAGAWTFVRRRKTIPKPRSVASIIALATEIVGISWFWLMPRMVSDVSSAHGFAVSRRLGEAGMLLAAVSLVASLFATGKVRVLAALSAVGILGMWASIGFLPF